jgi:hypothetical protein
MDVVVIVVLLAVVGTLAGIFFGTVVLLIASLVLLAAGFWFVSRVAKGEPRGTSGALGFFLLTCLVLGTLVGSAWVSHLVTIVVRRLA